nr:hypothetical protein [Marinilabilia salmonicolor]
MVKSLDNTQRFWRTTSGSIQITGCGRIGGGNENRRNSYNRKTNKVRKKREYNK